MARKPITKANPYSPTRGQFAGQTFTTERQYRDALAVAKGQGSLAQQQKASTGAITSVKKLLGLDRKEQLDYKNSLDVLKQMRREGLDLDTAAKLEHMPVDDVRTRLAPYLVERDGKFYASDKDRLIRQMVMLTEDGPTPIYVKDSRSASLIGQYWNAVHSYLQTGDDRLLQHFKGKSITADGKVYPFIVDTAVLDALDEQGALDFDDIYTLSR